MGHTHAALQEAVKQMTNTFHVATVQCLQQPGMVIQLRFQAGKLAPSLAASLGIGRQCLAHAAKVLLEPAVAHEVHL